MKKEEAFQPFKNIETAIRKIAADLSLEMGKFIITLDDSGNHVLQLSFLMKPEAIMTNDELEQKGFDDEFEKLAKRLNIEQINAERSEKARSEIEDWLKDE